MKKLVYIAAATTVLFAATAGADVRFTPSPVYLPSGTAMSWSAFHAVQGASGLVESNGQISRLGALANGRLVRSLPMIPALYEFATSTIVNGNASRVLVAGRVGTRMSSSPCVALYSTDDATPIWEALGNPMDVRFIAVTRYAGDRDMDFIVTGSSGGMAMYRASAPDTRVWWRPLNGVVQALKEIPQTAFTPARVAHLTDATLTIADAGTGEIFWQTNVFGGRELAVGDLTGDGRPEVVVRRLNGGTTAFELMTPGVLWSHTDVNSSAIAIGDYNGDGIGDVLDQNNARLRWLNGPDGNPVGVPANLSLGTTASARLILADVYGTSEKEVVSIVNGGDAPGTYVYNLALTQRWHREMAQMPDRPDFRSGDIDADGQAELITLGRPGDAQFYASLIRVANPANGSEKWVGYSSGAATPFQSGDVFVDFDHAQLDADPAREIVLVGTSAVSTQVIVAFDGATYQRQRRETVAFPNTQKLTGIRAVPASAPAGITDLLVTGGYWNNGFGTNLFLLDGTTLQPRWTLPLPSADYDPMHFEIRQMDEDAAFEAVFASYNGVRIVDLQTGQIQRELATQAYSYAIQDVPGGHRVLTFNNRVLTVIDLASGAVLDRFALNTEYATLAVDPADPDRLFVAADTRRIHALRLSSASEDGRSALVVLPFGNFETSNVKLAMRDGRLLLSDRNGVQALDPTIIESSLFADHFEEPLLARLPLTP
ncbi:MAG TPA: VCBS repeat-containing protein [Tahibacter sp.]|nr:VCBS repeat-containing protein [Tahibacter sp.]